MPDWQLHFVISAPRSGSTWLCNALNRHPEIFATEQRLFGEFFEVWKNHDGSQSPRMTFDSYARTFSNHYFFNDLGMNRSKFLRKFQRSFVKFLANFGARHSGKRIVVDKITPYPGTAGRVVEQIRELLPESTIIQLVRDGRDVVTSGTFDWLMREEPGAPRRCYFVDQIKGTKLERFFDDAVVEKWAQNWRESIDIFSDSPPELSISYEAMKRDQGELLQSVFRVLGAEASADVAANCASHVTFEAMTGRASGDGQPTAKTRKGIVGDWKNYFTREDAKIFDSIAGRELIDLGYEPNRDWIEHCPFQLNLIC